MSSLLARLAARIPGVKAAVLDEIPALIRYPESKSGTAVTVANSLEVTTVLACARVIAEGVAQVPWLVRMPGKGGRGYLPAKEHPLFKLLGKRPNPWQTSFEFRETLLFHLVLTGNAFVYLNRVGDDGRIVELIPIEPGRVLVTRNRDMSLTYQVTFDNGESPRLSSREIWHLKGASWTSWLGLQPVKLAREAIGLALATEAAHAALHKNGAQTTGVLAVNETLTAEQFVMLRDWIAQELTGGNKAGPLVVDRGATFTPTGLKGVDTEHVATRKLQVEEICRALRVMPIMVGLSDKTATYASAEQMFLAHVVHTLTPWCTRLEQSAELNLLSEADELAGLDIHFDLRKLLRGAAKDRADFWAKALGAGGHQPWACPNDAREDEGLNPIEGGDELPDRAPAAAAATAAGDAEDDDTPPSQDD
jgi:HK97 family phage portal protein